jgi:hypothetical protein
VGVGVGKRNGYRMKQRGCGKKNLLQFIGTHNRIVRARKSSIMHNCRTMLMLRIDGVVGVWGPKVENKEYTLILLTTQPNGSVI